MVCLVGMCSGVCVHLTHSLLRFTVMNYVYASRL